MPFARGRKQRPVQRAPAEGEEDGYGIIKTNAYFLFYYGPWVYDGKEKYYGRKIQPVHILAGCEYR